MTNEIKVYKDVLQKNDFLLLKNTLLSAEFPWYLNEVLDKKLLDSIKEEYNFQFCHTFYRDYKPNSDRFFLVKPLLDVLDPMSILRIKANITGRTEKIVEHGYHTDYTNDVKCITGVFYVNTNDGYTKFESGEVVESSENTLVLFDSRLKHTGTTCTNTNVRCVININFTQWQ